MPEEERNDQEFYSCTRKRRFWTLKAASKSARTAGETHAARYRAYRCRYCGSFHLATVRTARRRNTQLGYDRAGEVVDEVERERLRRAAPVLERLLNNLLNRKGVDRMSVEMIPVESSNVRAIGLDGARILVQFDNSVYECVRVDGNWSRAAVAFEDFENAGSKGQFYHQQIRRMPAVWNVRKLEGAVMGAAGAGAETPLAGVGEARTGFELTEDLSGAPAQVEEFSPPPGGNAEGAYVSGTVVRIGPHAFLYGHPADSGAWADDFCERCTLTRKHPIHLPMEKAVENSTRTPESLRPAPSISAGWPIVGRCAVCSFPLIRLTLPARPTHRPVSSTRVICPTCTFGHMEQIRELSMPVRYDESEFGETAEASSLEVLGLHIATNTWNYTRLPSHARSQPFATRAEAEAAKREGWLIWSGKEGGE